WRVGGRQKYGGIGLAVPMFVGMGLLFAMELPGRTFRPIRGVAYWATSVLSGIVVFPLVRLLVRAVGGSAGDLGDAPPTTTTRQVYLLWFWALLGVSVLGKGPPALGIAGFACLFYIVLLGRWRSLAADRYELVRGTAIVLLICVPWHVAMYLREGRAFLHEYFVVHLLNRAASPVEGDRGTF